MLNKLTAFICQHNMLRKGDHVICAVSGGADSVALLFALYLLKDKLQISICAAHFNHGLRGEESDADEAFVRELCERYGIELHVGRGQVVSGKKGLEAAARDARYAFLKSIDGKIATAHTANDNAETVLMHLIRGTGLKGLGGIAPVNGSLIRPMLAITRQEVLTFLQEYHLAYITDSSNETDGFLRNRLRHHVMPFLMQENPRLCENISALAMRLRDDEAVLEGLSDTEELPTVSQLLKMPPALRRRSIAAFLCRSGVPEPESEHIAMVEKLAFSGRPSAKANLPGGIVVVRNYDTLEVQKLLPALQCMELPCPGNVPLHELGLRVLCRPATEASDCTDSFTVVPRGRIVVRCRQSWDTIRLSGGSKKLKELFIDRKIPASKRMQIPVIADDGGVLGVYGIGVNRDRLAIQLPAVEICFKTI